MSVTRARELRRQATEAERLLWRHLRDRQLAGVKFRRQHPIGRYVADFCCEEAMLVVELDGGRHAETVARDARRTRQMEAFGYRVVRYWNGDVLRNIDGVLADIRARAGDSI